jgi:hypothetical protein
VDIARSAGMCLIGRAVSGQPQVWLPEGRGTRGE